MKKEITEELVPVLPATETEAGFMIRPGLFQVSGAVPEASASPYLPGAPIPVNSVCFTGMRTPPLRFFLFRRTAGSAIPIL